MVNFKIYKTCIKGFINQTGFKNPKVFVIDLQLDSRAYFRKTGHQCIMNK